MRASSRSSNTYLLRISHYGRCHCINASNSYGKRASLPFSIPKPQQQILCIRRSLLQRTYAPSVSNFNTH